MFGFFDSKIDYEKIFSSIDGVHKYIYGKKSKIVEVLGNEDFINAWLDSPNIEIVTAVIKSEALKGDIPSLNQMIWVCDLYYKDVENLNINEAERRKLRINHLKDRIDYCKIAIDLGAIDKSYSAMVSCANLYAILASQKAEMSDAMVVGAINGIVKYSTLFIKSGYDDPGMMSDANELLVQYTKIAQVIAAFNEQESVKINMEKDNKLKKTNEGKHLFELGMKYASQYKCSEAINYYTLSIQANENPAPYINRAKILAKRIRYYEALQDLLCAKRLDEEQSNEFSREISLELAIARGLTHNYETGMRDGLIEDFKKNGREYVSDQIICAAFSISHSKWEYNALDGTFLEYHFFNELDNIKKFDDLSNYPEVARNLEAYPAGFIDHKLNLISNSDFEIYQQQELQLHAFLCVYDEKDMQYIRRTILYGIERKLMERDFGDLWDSLSSECNGITREAAKYTSSRS